MAKAKPFHFRRVNNDTGKTLDQEFPNERAARTQISYSLHDNLNKSIREASDFAGSVPIGEPTPYGPYTFTIAPA